MQISRKENCLVADIMKPVGPILKWVRTEPLLPWKHVRGQVDLPAADRFRSGSRGQPAAESYEKPEVAHISCARGFKKNFINRFTS